MGINIDFCLGIWRVTELCQYFDFFNKQFRVSFISLANLVLLKTIGGAGKYVFPLLKLTTTGIL